MPTLILTKTPDGSASGEKHPLGSIPMVIGRSPEECQIVLGGHAVSRKHAQIVNVSGQYYIEDLKSRNKTYLNNKLVDGRANRPLKDGDNIKICDFLFSFYDERAQKILPNLPEPTPEVEVEDHSTTVEATFQRIPAQQFLDVQPQEKLRAILDISTALSKTLNVEALMPQIADELFKIFRQADRCFIIELDADDQLRPVVAKTRRPSPGHEVYSRTIVRRCLKTLESYLSEDASSDQAMNAAQSIAEFKIRSVMCVPLATQDGKALGVIQLDNQDRTKKFSQDDVKLLICVAAQASIALENARMHSTILYQQKLEEENLAATKVQRGFLPQTFPLLPGYEFFAHYTAARTVGGDYYDFIPLSDGRLAILLGDVSGKGVPAALLMARLSGEARVSMLTQLDLATAISHLNDQLLQANLEDRYVTLSAAVIDPKANKVDFVSAGHLSPWHYDSRANKLIKILEKDSGDFPIGWVPGHLYKTISVQLSPGDSIIVYTDGIEDAQPASGERFLESGVCDTIAKAATATQSLTAREIGTRIVQAVKKHVGNHPQFDDIALVCYGRSVPGQNSTPTVARSAPGNADLG